MKAPKARGTPWSERRKSRVDRFLAWQPKPETSFEKLDWINSNLQICWYRPFKICCGTGSVLCRIALWDCFGGCFENSFPTQTRNKQRKKQPRYLEQCNSAIQWKTDPPSSARANSKVVKTKGWKLFSLVALSLRKANFVRRNIGL